MGIADAFDKHGTPVITPDKVYDTKITHADTCIVTFSHAVLDKVLDEFNHIIAGQIGSANGMADVYYLPETHGMLWRVSTFRTRSWFSMAI